MSENVWVLLDTAAPGVAEAELNDDGEYTPAWASVFSNPGRALLELEFVNLGSARFAELEWTRSHRYYLEAVAKDGRWFLLHRNRLDAGTALAERAAARAAARAAVPAWLVEE